MTVSLLTAHTPRGLLPRIYKARILVDIPTDLVEQAKQTNDIVMSTWGACTEPDPETPGAPFFRVRRAF